MEKIRTIIVDDEKISRDGLQQLIEEKKDFEIVAVCRNGREAVSELKKKPTDLLLLDIQMPDLTGFDVVKEIEPEKLPEIIFITAHDEYAIKAFEWHAIDYILKPFSQERFDKALEKACRRIRNDKLRLHSEELFSLLSTLSNRVEGNAPELLRKENLQRVMVRVKDSIKFIDINDIDWIEGADYYVIIHSGGRSFLHRDTMKNLEARLPPSLFIRIHVSTIVNINQIQEIKLRGKLDCEVIMQNGESLKVSRRRRSQLMSLGTEMFNSKD